MKSAIKDGVTRYCIAVFSIIAATQVRMWIEPWVGDHVPFGTFLIAVVLTAWLAGTGPAVLSLLLGIVAAAHYVIPPANTLWITNPHAVLSLAVYGIVGLVTIFLFDLICHQHNLTRGQLKQIRKLTIELKTSDRYKDEFLALLAHELRNPLAPVRSGLQLLQKDGIEEHERSQMLKTVCRQLEQLIRIVDDLLDVSRFVHGQVVLDREPLDLRDSVETAIEQAQPDFSERNHEVQLLMPVQPVPVSGDRIRLVQIMVNLLTNASKYTPRQGRIQILLENTGEQAIFSVTDNGIGIAREMQQHIFELFARSDAAISRDRSGLDLGLPIAKQFADLHDGSLRVSSEGADQGSRFELILPLIPMEQLKKTIPQPPAVPLRFADTHSEQPVDSQKTRVLIVDDNVAAAETLGLLLGFDGYETLCVHDGFQALMRVNEFRPDIVLLDIGLPGMDGYEVARRLREEFLLQPLLLIAVTGWGGESDLRKSRQAGIDHHLVKPVDPAQLSQLLRTALPHSAAMVAD